MPTTGKGLSRSEYRKLLLKIAWERTKKHCDPWVRRLKEHIIRSLFLVLVLILSPALISIIHSRKEIVSVQTVLLALIVAGFMLVFVVGILIFRFLLNLANAHYEHHRKMESQIQTWIFRLNSETEMRRQLETNLESLRRGPSDSDMAELLADELGRNKGLKGTLTGSPEHKYLDAMIERLEHQRMKNELGEALYELRRRTVDQEKLASYSGSRQGQYNAYYLPALEKAEAALRAFLLTPKDEGNARDSAR